MNKSALLVVDMQNVYLSENKWACIKMDKVIEYIQEKIKEFQKNEIFFTQHLASQNPKGQWREYNKKYKYINENEELNEYIPEIKKYVTKENLFIKSGFSALSNKNLLQTLEQFDTIYITGVIAECCVLSTIFSLIDMGKKIVYCTEGIAGQSEEKEKMIIKILEDLSPIHVVFE